MAAEAVYQRQVPLVAMQPVARVTSRRAQLAQPALSYQLLLTINYQDIW
ncbi:hypothetical protein V5P93_004041 [Actinokineospora auranticolor]|nr:hypothetical protein [Actinokineospora auranticolor]